MCHTCARRGTRRVTPAFVRILAPCLLQSAMQSRGRREGEGERKRSFDFPTASAAHPTKLIYTGFGDYQSPRTHLIYPTSEGGWWGKVRPFKYTYPNALNARWLRTAAAVPSIMSGATKSLGPSRISVSRAAYFNINLRLRRRILSPPWVLKKESGRIYFFGPPRDVARSASRLCQNNQRLLLSERGTSSRILSFTILWRQHADTPARRREDPLRLLASSARDYFDTRYSARRKGERQKGKLTLIL